MIGHDIIAAPATAAGGAIAVIRVSGDGAVECCDRIFRGGCKLSEAAPYTVHYGTIADGERIVDDVLATVFRAPHSYTGEDGVELSVHGSQYIVSEVLALLLRNGARMAAAGEFSARAFLAGKMDLSQAEAVADMIAADSRAAHALASTQMRGGYSAKLGCLREQLLKIASLLELELDFSEEDVEFADREELRRTMTETAAEIERLAASFSLGNAIKEGVAVAIVGAPNAGKSTLLNRLLGENRAMVSEIAGTTRDTIEERMNIDGVVFRFIDTAGLRDTADRLEALGIERTRRAIERAKIVIQLVEPDAEYEPLKVSAEQRLVLAINKIDIRRPTIVPDGAVLISAQTGEGIDALSAAVRAAVDTSELYAGSVVVSSARHREALEAAAAALSRAAAALDDGLPSDLLSEDIREVLHHLGTITGEITTDEILGNIFSKFCIGK